MTGQSSALMERTVQAATTTQYADHLCSNCRQPATPEDDVAPGSGLTVYTCPTCGQREEVRVRTIPARIVTQVRILEEPHIILGDI